METVKTGVNDRPDLSLAVVVGAGGLGMAAARKLGQCHRILLTDKDADRLAGEVAALQSEGHDACGHVCDITDPEAVDRLAAAAREAGPVQVLAHVAALSPSMGDWETIMRVNLVGAALMERAIHANAAPGLAAVFVSSLAAHGVAPTPEVQAILADPLHGDFADRLGTAIGEARSSQLAYQLSKFALNRMVERRAAAWGERGARIVSLSPGLIATPMGALEFKNVPAKYALLERSPIRREGTMLEVADAIGFLASRAASFITGTDLLVDGGIAAALKHG